MTLKPNLGPKIALQVLAALLPLSLGGVIWARGRAVRATVELKAALERNDYASVPRLAAVASDVDVRPDIAGYTPLQAALAQGDDATARLLIERGANVNLAPLPSVRRPLDMAVWNASPDEVRLLLAHGAGVRASTIELARQCASHTPRDPAACPATNTICGARAVLPMILKAAREQQVLAGT